VRSLGSAHILQSDIDDQMIKRTMPGICDATHPKCSVCYLWKDCQDGYLMFSYPEFSSCSTALQREAWSKRDLQSIKAVAVKIKVIYMIDETVMNKLIAFSAACPLPAVNQIRLVRGKVGVAVLLRGPCLGASQQPLCPLKIFSITCLHFFSLP